MTSKERMMTALGRGKPDRLPMTIHQWQPFHLEKFMGGMDQLEAFLSLGLDASITPDVLRQKESSDWRISSRPEKVGRETHTRYVISTPVGELTYVSAANEYTTFRTEHIIKSKEDAGIFLKYWPDYYVDRKTLDAWYDRTGDAGIVRGFVSSYAQPGSWQDFCEMVGTQEAIFWAVDEPDFVHHFLAEITRRKVEFVRREFSGIKFDLIEHGGGAASSTVISPAMFDEFCVPYDRQVIAAIHEAGLPVTYHTCGGMMAILDRIPHNGCDASETLSPTGVGGDIRPEDRLTVKKVLGSKVAMIGGIDQGKLLSEGTPEQIAGEVRSCFETFGLGGGYICSASDHFFHAPVKSLKALADAAREWVY